MSRPKGTKNNMRSPQQKIAILHELFDSNMDCTLICKKHNISFSTLRKWRLLYDQGGINALHSNTGKFKGDFKGRPLHNNEDALKRKIRDLEIEVARLKKGYLVKGVGAKKVFVTSLDQNTK